MRHGTAQHYNDYHGMWVVPIPLPPFPRARLLKRKRKLAFYLPLWPLLGASSSLDFFLVPQFSSAFAYTAF